MLAEKTTTAAWSGFQILLGQGRGMSTQGVRILSQRSTIKLTTQPVLAVQNGVNPDDLSTAMAVLTSSQTFGGSVFLSLASVIFKQGLKSQIPRYAPGVDPNDVIAFGATGFRDVVPGDALTGVLEGYARGVGWVFYLAAALCIVQLDVVGGWAGLM